jgi:sterol desaturase/sphingolipid hydroxylase (fatty acid hydroxylase superfamily)
VGQVFLAIAVADVGITLAHFVSHRSEILWRFHAVHHSIHRMYGFNGLMKHPLHQAIELTCASVPLLLLGMPLEVAWLLGFAVAVQLLLQHSNVDLEIGPLLHVWAVAPAHRFHHLNRAGDGDVNFGLFSSVWDRLLGTFRYDATKTPRVGDLGIDGRPDYPVGYLAQLVEPFRARP